MDDSETPGTFPALKRSCSTLGPSAVPVKCGSTKTARRLFECLVDPYLPSAASRPEALHHIAINSQTQQLLCGLKLRTTLPAFSGQNCDQTGGQYRKRRFRQPEIFFAPHRIVSVRLCRSLSRNCSVPSDWRASGRITLMPPERGVITTVKEQTIDHA